MNRNTIAKPLACVTAFAAFAATAEYLKLRFPEDADSRRKLKKHFHRLLCELAKMLLVSYRAGIGAGLPIEEEDRHFLPETGGVVVVLAHCGCWQSSMDLMNRSSGRVINNNRTIGKTVCSGQGKLASIQANAQNRQKATYSGTLNIYGPVTVGSD